MPAAVYGAVVDDGVEAELERIVPVRRGWLVPRNGGPCADVPFRPDKPWTELAGSCARTTLTSFPACRVPITSQGKGSRGGLGSGTVGTQHLAVASPEGKRQKIPP